MRISDWSSDVCSFRSLPSAYNVGEHADVVGGGEAALIGVEHVGPDHRFAGQRGDADLGLAIEAGVGRLPAVQSSLVLGGHVVDGDEDLLERVLDESGEGAVPTVLLADEGAPTPLQTAGVRQRGGWTTFAQSGGAERRG